MQASCATRNFRSFWTRHQPLKFPTTWCQAKGNEPKSDSHEEETHWRSILIKILLFLLRRGHVRLFKPDSNFKTAYVQAQAQENLTQDRLFAIMPGSRVTHCTSNDGGPCKGRTRVFMQRRYGVFYSSTNLCTRLRSTNRRQWLNRLTVERRWE